MIILNPRYLSYFVAAAELGSFRRAGLALGARESSVSRGIRALEERVGGALFERRSAGVVLTEHGSRFLARARLALESLIYKVPNRNIIGAETGQCLRVGICSSLASGFLPQLFRIYLADLENQRVWFSERSSADQISAVRARHIDVAFVDIGASIPDLKALCVYSEQLLAAVPIHHHLAHKELIMWQDLVGEKIILSDRALSREINTRVLTCVSIFDQGVTFQKQDISRDNLIALVAMGFGVAIVNQSTTTGILPEVVYRPLVGERIILSAVWSANNESAALYRLLKLAVPMTSHC